MTTNRTGRRATIGSVIAMLLAILLTTAAAAGPPVQDATVETTIDSYVPGQIDFTTTVSDQGDAQDAGALYELFEGATCEGDIVAETRIDDFDGPSAQTRSGSITHSSTAATVSLRTVYNGSTISGDELDDLARLVFGGSDNDATYDVIQVAGGLSVVNDWTESYGTTTDDFSPPNRPVITDPRYAFSTATMAGMTDFLYDLATGALLSPELTEQVLAWAELAPQAGPVSFTNAVVALLPNGPHPTKHGWLPSNQGFGGYADGNTSGMALVTTSTGVEYAVALGIRDGDDAGYFTGNQWIADTSLAIYDLLDSGGTIAQVQSLLETEVDAARAAGVADVAGSVRLISTGESATYERLDSGFGDLHRSSTVKFLWAVAALQGWHGESCVAIEQLDPISVIKTSDSYWTAAGGPLSENDLTGTVFELRLDTDGTFDPTDPTTYEELVDAHTVAAGDFTGPNLAAFELEPTTPGDYLIVETNIPAGYVTQRYLQFTVDLAGELVLPNTYSDGFPYLSDSCRSGPADAVEFCNSVELGSVVWEKRDLDTGELVDGSAFTLEYDEAADGSFSTLIGEDLMPQQIDGLEPGAYRLTETQVPDWYTASSTVTEFTVAADETTQLTGDASITNTFVPPEISTQVLDPVITYGNDTLDELTVENVPPGYGWTATFNYYGEIEPGTDLTEVCVADNLVSTQSITGEGSGVFESPIETGTSGHGTIQVLFQADIDDDRGTVTDDCGLESESFYVVPDVYSVFTEPVADDAKDEAEIVILYGLTEGHDATITAGTYVAGTECAGEPLTSGTVDVTGLRFERTDHRVSVPTDLDPGSYDTVATVELLTDAGDPTGAIGAHACADPNETFEVPEPPLEITTNASGPDQLYEDDGTLGEFVDDLTWMLPAGVEGTRVVTVYAAPTLDELVCDESQQISQETTTVVGTGQVERTSSSPVSYVDGLLAYVAVESLTTDTQSVTQECGIAAQTVVVTDNTPTPPTTQPAPTPTTQPAPTPTTQAPAAPKPAPEPALVQTGMESWQIGLAGVGLLTLGVGARMAARRREEAVE